jgi:ribosome-binding ATPase YchF (GTP1/OBG family)
MSEEIIQDKPDTVTILGHELVKRPFTNTELDEWARINDERQVEAAQKRILSLQAERKNLASKRVELQQKAVEKLEAKLDAEYDKEEWDAERIAHLHARIIEESEKVEALQAADSERVASLAFEIAEKIDAEQAVTQEAHLEMVHYLAGKPVPFSEWLSSATLEDYQAARELLQAGVVPFGHRRTRKARSGKGTH